MSSSVNWKHLVLRSVGGSARSIPVPDTTAPGHGSSLLQTTQRVVIISTYTWTSSSRLAGVSKFRRGFIIYTWQWVVVFSYHRSFDFSPSQLGMKYDPYFVVTIILYFTLIMLIDDEISIAVNIITSERSTFMFLLIKPPLRALSREDIYLESIQTNVTVKPFHHSAHCRQRHARWALTQPHAAPWGQRVLPT